MRALTVIAVVLVHAQFGGLHVTPVTGVLFEWFSPSFVMPIFLFIAGYFFYETPKLLGYLKKRFKRLVVPYYWWNLVYAAIFLAVTSAGLLHWTNTVNLTTFLVQPWITGEQYAFNLAAWFVLALFLAQVAFALIRMVFSKFRVTNEFAVFAFFMILGLVGAYLYSLGYRDSFYLVLNRTLFGLPFLQLGYLYKTHLEKYDKPSLISICLLVIVQACLLYIYNNDLSFDMLHGDFRGRILQPFLSSFTGIWLYLQVSMLLSKLLSPTKLPSRVLRYVGDNSWSIMFHQFLGFWLLSTVFLFAGLDGFNVVAYQTDIYYRYLVGGYALSAMLYVFAGLLLPLVISYLVMKFRRRITALIKKRPFFQKRYLDEYD
jgi:fucose 4-O-acetylase-like acetyltransferase